MKTKVIGFEFREKHVLGAPWIASRYSVEKHDPVAATALDELTGYIGGHLEYRYVIGVSRPMEEDASNER